MENIFKWLRGRSSNYNTPYSYEVLPLTSGKAKDNDFLPPREEDIEPPQRNTKKKKTSLLSSLSSIYSYNSRNLILPSTTKTFQHTASIFFHKATLILKYILLYLIPSFIPRFASTDHQSTQRNKKVPPTAYLNGIRGLAAYIVFCQHFTTYFYGITPLWGYHAHPKKDTYIAQLPFIRLIHSGRFCVAIFYLLSGYVLGYKPLQLIRQGDIEGLGHNLSSAIFRRGLRLFLPLIPPLIFAAVCVYTGIYGTPNYPMRGSVVASAGGTVWAELVQTFRTFDKVVNPFAKGSFYPKTIPALYTLRVEFRGSIMVFTILFGLAKARAGMRMGVITAIASYSLQHGRWDAFLFLCGAILAEMRYIRTSSTVSCKVFSDNSSLIQLLRYLKVAFWLSTLTLSLFLGSFPRRGAKNTPGYRTLTRVSPANYSSDDGLASFWCSIGAVLLISSLENLPVLQRPFNTAFARYMGDISFSLYVFHVPLYLTVGRWITVLLIKRTGSYVLGFFGGGALLTGVLVVVADLQWRAVDMNTVKFARWLEVRVFP